MPMQYQNMIGKPIKIRGMLIPFDLCKEILNTDSIFIIICPYDEWFIQYITDMNYYLKYNFPDTDCSLDYFIEVLCNDYLEKYKKRRLKKNKNNWNNILREVIKIYKQNN